MDPTISSLSKYNSGIPNGVLKSDAHEIIEQKISKAVSAIDLDPALEAHNIPKHNVVKATWMHPIQARFVQASVGGALAISNYIYEVEGANLLDGLRRATELLEAKNPVLRTTIVPSGDGFLLVLLAEGKCKPKYITATSLSDYVSETKSIRLSFGRPIVHYCLVQNDKGKNYFVTSIEHVLFDAFSRSIWERDLLQALRSPSAYALEPERAWYGDFTAHLQATQNDEEVLKYWEKYIESAPFENLHHGKLQEAEAFDGFLCESISASIFVNRREFSSSTAILVAWSLALSNHSGLRDIVFGMVKLGRAHPYNGIDRLLGNLLSLTPFRLRIDDPTESTDSMLRRAQQGLISSGRWDQGATCGVMPSLDGTPYSQSFVNLKHTMSSIGASEVAGQGDVSKITARRDLERWDFAGAWAVILEVTTKDQDLVFDLRYVSRLLDHQHAKAIMDDFLRIMKALGSSTPLKIEELLKSEK